MRGADKKRLIIPAAIALVAVITTGVIAASRMDNGGRDELIEAAKEQEALEQAQASEAGVETVGTVAGASNGADGGGARPDALLGTSAGDDTTDQAGGSDNKKVIEDKTKGQPEGYLEFEDVKIAYYDDIETCLFIGTDESGDNRKSDVKTGYGGDMADFIGLAVVNKTKKTYTLLQIDRNTMTNMEMCFENGDMSGQWVEQQLCISHWYGITPEANDESTKKCVSALLGNIKIDNYYTVGVSCVPRMNHVIGGVDVTIEDDFSKEDKSLVKGRTIHLTDEQATRFVRGRMSVGDGENTSRMRRQRAYLDAYYKEAMKQIKERPGIINDIYRECMDMAETDLNGSDVSRLTNSFMTFENGGIRTLEGKNTEGESSDGEGKIWTRFYPDKKALENTMIELFGA